MSYQSRYGIIEPKKLGSTVLVQYYVCNANIPCVNVLGYVQQGSMERVSSGQEFIDKLHLPVNLMCIPEPHKAAIRRYVMSDTAARFSTDAPSVHFEKLGMDD
ncbi:MAG: hypothetical protein M3299_04430 [Thermoproteota archaeon]|nr:hypothetical protein [Thermoproteota archaeon]